MKKKPVKPVPTAQSLEHTQVNDLHFREIEEQPTEKQITKNLKCVLTPDELRVLGQELARANQTRDEIEERKKGIDAQLKADIEEQSARSLSLARKINNGYDYRDVPCVQRSSLETNTVTTIRLDTLVVIDTRAMTQEERQTSLLPLSELDA